jgi:hypothetical protein
LPKALADLKNLRVACSKEAFHAQLRRGMQESSTRRDRINVKLRRRRRDEARSLDLEIILFGEKTPDGLEQTGSQQEGGSLGA